MPDTIACPVEKKPSNTSYLSGDSCELSGWPLSPLQLIAIVGVIAQKLAPVKACEFGKNESAGRLESGAQS